MISIETKQPKKRAIIPFHAQQLPIAVGLYPQNPHLLQKNVFMLFETILRRIYKGVERSQTIWGSTFQPKAREISERLQKITNSCPAKQWHLFFCDDLYSEIHEDLTAMSPPGYADPILQIWTRLTDEEKKLDTTVYRTLSDFETFRKRFLLELRSLTFHERECRRIGFVYQNLRIRG